MHFITACLEPGKQAIAGSDLVHGQGGEGAGIAGNGGFGGCQPAIFGFGLGRANGNTALQCAGDHIATYLPVADTASGITQGIDVAQLLGVGNAFAARNLTLNPVHVAAQASTVIDLCC